MLKEYRLKNRASFNYIYRKGKTLRSSIITLHFVESTSIKMGISVSKKVGKSVVRNKTKRRIGEAFCRLAPHLYRPYNYVAVAREDIRESTFTEIIETLEILLKQGKHIPKEVSWRKSESLLKKEPEYSLEKE